MDNPKGIQFGGVVAAPIVQNILEDALHYMNVAPRKDQVAKEYKYGETKIVTVPDLTGATAEDLYEDLNMNFMLAKSGSGKYVINQAPKPGSRVEQGSTIRIYMSDVLKDAHQHAEEEGGTP